MKFRELTILLPCHSLEDFPQHHQGVEAEGLLACWTAMWHPALLGSAGRMPSWARADGPPDDLAGRLLLVPQVSESLLLAGWPARAKSEGACVIRKQHKRPAIVSQALSELDGAAPIPDSVAADFYALGLAYLHVELLTRQMRYMSNLDEVHFQAETLRAAEAAIAGDAESTRQRLASCFEMLTEARERFYPAEAYLLDLTLLAPTTLGEAFRGQLKDGSPGNVLISGVTLQEMANRERESLAVLRAAWDSGQISLIGGEFEELELPLFPPEAILAELNRGAAVYESLLGRRPQHFGRRRFGLTPLLPSILSRLGFQGALHATLEDGQFPKGDQSKLRWEGVDACAIEALCRLPLDASQPESFLSFPTKMGESMDLDHVATIVFAHWPGQDCPWYADFRRIASFGPVLGRFVTLADYFEKTDMGGRLTKFDPDLYRAPYLKQSVIRRQENPLSRIAALHHTAVEELTVSSLTMLAELLRGTKPQDGEQTVACSIQRFAAALPRNKPADAAETHGLLVANPHSFARTIGVELPPDAGLPAAAGPVRVVQNSPQRACAVVDVPAMGFTWIPLRPQAAAMASPGKAGSKPLAEGTTIRNEFMEVLVDPATGGIRAIHDYQTRGNRLSQQLAFRLPGAKPKPGDVWHDPDLDALYAVMQAKQVQVTSTGPALAEIVCRGALLDLEGRLLADFQQTLRLWRGCPVLSLEIELAPQEDPRSDPWNSYYASRFAWADEAADIARNVGWGLHPTEAKRLEAPLVVEVRDEKTRTAIFTGGLPYHRRTGLRMLDTLLMVRGESSHKHRLGIGLDLTNPIPHALDLMTPTTWRLDDLGRPTPVESSWLFHLDMKNVVATHWETITENGSVRGFRVRLVETAGRPGRAKLRAFRPIDTARHTDFLGVTLAELPVEDDAVSIDFAGFEWVQVEAKWR